MFCSDLTDDQVRMYMKSTGMVEKQFAKTGPIEDLRRHVQWIRDTHSPCDLPYPIAKQVNAPIQVTYNSSTPISYTSTIEIISISIAFVSLMIEIIKLF